jgi:hypothetical protein
VTRNSEAGVMVEVVVITSVGTGMSRLRTFRPGKSSPRPQRDRVFMSLVFTRAAVLIIWPVIIHASSLTLPRCLFTSSTYVMIPEVASSGITDS